MKIFFAPIPLCHLPLQSRGLTCTFDKFTLLPTPTDVWGPLPKLLVFNLPLLSSYLSLPNSPAPTADVAASPPAGPSPPTGSARRPLPGGAGRWHAPPRAGRWWARTPGRRAAQLCGTSTSAGTTSAHTLRILFAGFREMLTGGRCRVHPRRCCVRVVIVF
jgi:hypothetical protein